MPFAPYQWRAGKGYIPSPDAIPQFVTMPAGPTLYAYPYGGPPPPQYAHLIAHSSMPEVVAAAPPPPPKKKSVSLPPPPPPSTSAAPSKASSGPNTIIQGKDWRIVGNPHPGAGKWTITIPPPPPPPPSSAPVPNKKITIPPPPPCSTISPADSVSSTGSGTSLGSAAETGWKSRTKTQVTKKSRGGNGSSSKKPRTTTTTKLTHLQLCGGGGSSSPPPPSTSAPPSAALSTCPTLPPGTNYLFPPRAAHTILHIFNKTRPLWEDKYQGIPQQMHEFKMFKVAVKFTVREVVERVVGKKGAGDGLEKWAVTECHEQGGGRWKKGTTIPYSSDRAAGTLESMGWDSKRGKERSPVWLVVHRG